MAGAGRLSENRGDKVSSVPRQEAGRGHWGVGVGQQTLEALTGQTGEPLSLTLRTISKAIPCSLPSHAHRIISNRKGRQEPQEFKASHNILIGK